MSSASYSSPPHSFSMAEAKSYYFGLYSSPTLVYRTGTTPWMMPTGLEAYRPLKELRPVYRHRINVIWEVLGPQVCRLLDKEQLLWTSIDVVRFKVGEAPVGPVILWIGVIPETLSSEDAFTAANGCLGLLQQSGIDDVEVEFRGSIYTQSAGPTLLEPVFNPDPTIDVCGPLTPVLGPSIAAHDTPHIEGTGGLYLAEGGDSQKVLLVTARHVLFPPNLGLHINYVHPNTSAPRRNVILLGSRTFENLIKSIGANIRDQALAVDIHEQLMQRLQERLDGKDKVEEVTMKLHKTQRLLIEAKETIEALETFLKEVKTNWEAKKNRVIGHVVCSPPITFAAGTEGFTEDYAIVELDRAKFKKGFKGNVIDLGTKITTKEFMNKMYPRLDTPTRFKYPADRLLPLQGVISEDLMRSPDMLDENGEECLLVIKNGSTTGVTIGRATGIFSYVRQHFGNNTHQTSKEWAILPYNNRSGVFSDFGDSGSIIVDGCGQIGGLLTGGAGTIDATDITYATPFFWLLPRIKAKGFPNAHLNPHIA